MRRFDWAGLAATLKLGTRVQDLRVAAALLTRLPVALEPETAAARSRAAIWAYPAVGAIVGLFGGVVYAVAVGLGGAPGVAAALAIATQAIVTGFLHEDGLADSADGLGGGRDPEARLLIMRDSRLGAFGAGALMLVLLARWSAIAALPPGAAIVALTVAGALSRAAMVGAMWVLPFARQDGLAAMVGRPSNETALAGLALAALIALVAGWLGVVAVALVGAAAAAVSIAALRRIGGQTGDVLGAVQQASEVVALAALSAR